MEVLVGPTFSLDVSSAGYAARRSSGGEDPTDLVVAASREIGSGLSKPAAAADESSESSSSIGAPGDSDDDEDEVSSKADGRISRKFGSLGSLEDALPVKRGLSSHFTGKSKSFANLSEVVCSMNNVKEVEKQENPFNKRRRILIQSRLARKSFYSSFNPNSMPLLPVVHEDDDSDQDEPRKQQYGDGDDDDDCQSELSSSSSSDDKQQHGRGVQQMQYSRFQKFHDRKLGGFKSHSCFSLSDLQEEDDD